MRIAQREKEILQKVEEKIARGPYEASWASLCEAQMPQWLAKEKLGIFIHWGVYSVPANSNEWYPRNMYKEGMPAYEHHRKTYGLQKNFGYKDFIPMFRAEHFCPAEWMELGLPAFSVKKGSILERTSGLTAVVAALSR